MLYEIVFSVQESDRLQLAKVWEAWVRATHHFLNEADIHFFRAFVRDGRIGAMKLACVRDSSAKLIAFAGVDGEKLEALFVDPQYLGSGLGRRPLEYTVNSMGARTADVNEQNEHAIGFYKRMGLIVEGRSAFDSIGRSFPLLHMRLL